MEVEPSVLFLLFSSPPSFLHHNEPFRFFQGFIYIWFSEILPSQFQSDLFSRKFGDRNFNTVFLNLILGL